MGNIKINPDKVIESSPIMRKETGIEFLMECITDSSNPKIYEIAQQKQMDVMNDFSQWIHDNQWSKNNNNALWFHYKKMYDDFEFSEVYQLFLTSKKQAE